jgi:hypothetical protein
LDKDFIIYIPLPDSFFKFSDKIGLSIVEKLNLSLHPEFEHG